MQWSYIKRSLALVVLQFVNGGGAVMFLLWTCCWVGREVLSSYFVPCDELGRCDFLGDFSLKLVLRFLWIFLGSLLLVNGDCLQVSRAFLLRGWACGWSLLWS